MMKRTYKKRRKSVDGKLSLCSSKSREMQYTSEICNEAPLKIVLRIPSNISRDLKMSDDNAIKKSKLMNECSSVHETNEIAAADNNEVEAAVKRQITCDDSVDRPKRLAKKFKGEDPLTLSLKHLQQILIKKDKEQFFQYPITDQFAPGYSQIVSNPMDFSTMMKKIKSNEYHSISEYRDDFKLMCDNAFLYNKRDTVYYRRAEKLLAFGMKILSRERISSMCKSLDFMTKLSREEIGDLVSLRKPDTNKSRTFENNKPSVSKRGFSCTQDNLTVDQVLEQAKRARAKASERLKMTHPNSKMGFLRVQEDGSTTFTFITSGERREERPLGESVGQLESGTNLLPFYREDRRNIIRPVNGLDYGAYGSNGPDHDSSFSSLLKDDSNVLLSVYGNEFIDTYTSSIQDYVTGCSSCLTDYVDSVLNGLTDGEHMKQKELERETQNEESDTVENASCTKELDNSDNQLIEQILLETNSLILELNAARDKRLSQNPGINGTLRNSVPNEKETQIAKSVQDKLSGMIKHTQPGDVISANSIHKALGINIDNVKN